jgi:hypothetical protein
MKSSIFLSLVFASALNAEVKINDNLTVSGYVTVIAEAPKNTIPRTYGEPSFLKFELPEALQAIQFKEATLEFSIPEGIITKEILESTVPVLLPSFDPSPSCLL